MNKQIKFLILFFIIFGMMYPVGMNITNHVDAQSTSNFKIDIISPFPYTHLEDVLIRFNTSDFAVNNNFHYPQNISWTSGIGNYDGYKSYIERDIIDTDLVWGSPRYITEQLIADNLVMPITNSTFLSWVDTNLPDKIGMSEIKKYEGDNLMSIASAIASNGIVVNNRSLAENGFEFPTNYTDLGTIDYFTQTSDSVSITDPLNSIAGFSSYASILQEFGWENGWELIYHIAGNSYISDNSAETIANTIMGDTSMSLSNSYQYLSKFEQNPNVDFHVPKSSNSMTRADLVIPNDIDPEEQPFIYELMKFILSEEGQSLTFSKENPMLPIRSDAFNFAHSQLPDEYGYSSEYIDMANLLFNEINTSEVEPLNEMYYFTNVLSSVKNYFTATITNANEELKKAWNELNIAKKEAQITLGQYSTLLENFGNVGIDEATARELNIDMSKGGPFTTSKIEEWGNEAVSRFNGILYTLNEYKNDTSSMENSEEKSTEDSTPGLELSTHYLWFSSFITLTVFTIYRKKMKL